jgi:mannose-6-phosphate isomerase-like protein (cupin superfamily)
LQTPPTKGEKEEFMKLTRREICSQVPASLLFGFVAEAAAAQEIPLPSEFYPFEKLPVRTVGDAQYRAILKGKLATGESLEVHETTLGPHGTPHPPHHHVHTEFWLIREGVVEMTINGRSSRLEAGSAGFAASNEEHGIKNLGDTPATYFVVAVGPGAGS